MKGFLSFRHFKRLLKIAAMAWALTAGGNAWGQTAYRWTNGAGNTNTKWKTSTNWKKYTGTIQYDSDGNAKMYDVVNDTTHWTDLETEEYPGKNSNTDYVSISGDYTVTLDTDITISNLYIDIDSNGNNQTVTLNTGTYTLTASDNIFTGCYLGSGGSTNTFNSSFSIDGSGTVTVGTFDFPNYKTHTITINSKATFKITGLFFGNSSNGGTLNVEGNGTLYVPASGADLNYGDCVITYASDLSIKPYGNPTYYSVTLNDISKLSDNGASITISRNTKGDHEVKYPYSVKDLVTQVTGAAFYFNGATLKPNTTSSLSITTGSDYKKKFPITTSGELNEGDGFTIEIRTPDNARVLSTIRWYKGKTSWTGNVDTVWEKENNWILADSGKSLAENLKTTDLVITAVPNKPVISSGTWELKSLEITANASVTMTGGTIKTEKILLTADTSKFIGKNSTSTNGGKVELNGNATFGYKDGITKDTIALKELSIAENASFTMQNDLDLDMLILNSNSTFKKGATESSKYNLTLGWLQVQTANFSGSAGNITLTEAFEADSIILLLRDGNIIAENNLTARKDIIIAGPNYNSSSLKYQHFTSRPSGWVKSFTKTSLDINSGDPVSSSSTLSIAAGKSLTAGTSGKGNFYINGATLTGSSGNNLVIPQNDSPENFCAEAVNSTISNITVTCADGSHAQIPATDCSLTGCTNFDSQEFGISSATTVSDNRIYLKFPRPIRKITYPSAIKTSDGTGFTAEYASETGSNAPANPKSSLYLYTANTTWNTDASGTSAGSGSYTNSNGEYRTVIPYLVIPQYITDSSGKVTCGYVITDKWGKRLKSYSPDASAFKDVTDGIPEDKKTKRTPPEFSLSLSPVNNNQIVLGFSKPIITSSSKISYYIDSDNRISISQTMEELLPRCFEIVSIDPAGNAASADIQIDKNSRASISQSSTGLSTITLTLTRNITLSDIENLYIRLIAPKDDSGTLLYPITTYDHQTGKTGLAVSFIQESDKAHTKDGAIYMALNTAHSISDFAIGAINPSYAYNSGLSDGGEDLASAYRNIYGEGSSAVHDFSKNQKNYGTISYGSEITLVSKSTSSINSLKLFITDDVDSDSFFKTFSSNFDKQSEAWLPNLTGKIFNYYSSALNSNFQTFNGEAIKSGASNQGFNTIIPKESVIKMKSGSQLSFVYTICDSSQNPLSHILSPIMTNTETGTYDLSKSVTYPLFALNLSNSSDLLSLSPWYITLKSITEQRGGVTILNNVINAAVGEKTVLKVNMPSSGNLDIMIMTIDGNIVKYLAHGNASAGEHFYYWDGRNNAGSEVARGMYFVIVKAPGIDENRKVMVVK